MQASYRNEKEVEANLLAPLFRQVLRYPDNDLEWAKPIKSVLGHETSTKQANLVVSYHNRPVITVEAKKPTEPIQRGIGQVDSYASALATPYSIVTNGKQLVVRGYFSFDSKINVIDESVDQLKRSGWKKLKNLVGYDVISSAITEKPNPVTQPDTVKIENYRKFFRKIHSVIRDHDRLDPSAAFDELSKLLFLKAAEDEWGNQKTMSMLTPSKIDEWERLGKGRSQKFVNQWFRDATTELFPGVFGDHPKIELTPATLKVVLELLQPFRLKDGDVDIKGRAFEEFLPSQLRGKGLGQYFTPRPIVNFMASMADISIQDVVVDFSCGSGGFLIKAFEQMKGEVDRLPVGTLKRIGTTRTRLLDNIRENQIFGIDAEPRAARTAKMNMLMWGDGRKIVRGNALDTKDVSGNPYEVSEYDEDAPSSGCTLILANPPFGSREKDKSVLKHYVLGSGRQDRDGQKTEILFIEKGLNLLRPEGRMLIVIPQGIMSGQSLAYVRRHIHSQAEIRAVISLPTHTFVQSGVPTVNTCILYVQKFTRDKKNLYDERTAGLSDDDIAKLIRSDPEFDYPIFMGTAEYVGYEPSGRMIVTVGEETDLDLLLKDFDNQHNLPIPDIDLFEFAGRYYGNRAFRKKDQVIRGTTKGLKTSFVIKLSETEDRLDPTFYLFRQQAANLIKTLTPLGSRIKSARQFLRQPTTDEELDSEYSVLSVSSDGAISLSEHIRGESITQKYLRVRTDDVVYNPMRINIGSIGVVPKEFDGGLVSPDYVVFRSTELLPDFLCTLLRSPFYRLYIDVISTGSIRDRLYFGGLQTVRIPDVGKVEQFAVHDAVQRAELSMRDHLSQIAGEQGSIAARLHRLVRISNTDVLSNERSKLFLALAEQWRAETGFYASVSRRVQHPAYRKIVQMGKTVLPLILAELRDRPGHWFSALSEIVGTTPVGEDERGSVQKSREAWLSWGRDNGYLD